MKPKQPKPKHREVLEGWIFGDMPRYQSDYNWFGATLAIRMDDPLHEAGYENWRKLRVTIEEMTNEAILKARSLRRQNES